MRFVPATALLAVLDGLGQLGLDVEHVRRQAGVPATIQDPETLLAENLLGEVWSAAFQLAPRESLPLEVGLAIPLGSFGLIDYLAASSDTVGEALHSLSRFFPSAGVGCTLEISQIGEDTGCFSRTSTRGSARLCVRSSRSASRCDTFATSLSPFRYKESI
jgi:hypothetical protein